MCPEHELHGADRNQPADRYDETGPASAWIDHAVVEVVRRPLPVWERMWNRTAVRYGLVVVLLAAAWEVSARWSEAPLLPPLSDALEVVWIDLSNGVLLLHMLRSLHALALGYAVGAVCALLLAAVAIISRLGRDVLSVLTTLLGPLPAVALLPLAFLWFGMGEASLVCVLVGSVLWPVASGASSGVQEVPDVLRMAGRNIGLRHVRYALWLLPAVLPSVLHGLRVGWVLAWSTLIAADLVIGAATGSGGIGWYIYENHARLDVPRVFAGLLSVVAVGALVEGGFRLVERHAARRLGGSVDRLTGPRSTL